MLLLQSTFDMYTLNKIILDIKMYTKKICKQKILIHNKSFCARL